jgi:hypothetical protein
MIVVYYKQHRELLLILQLKIRRAPAPIHTYTILSVSPWRPQCKSMRGVYKHSNSRLKCYSSGRVLAKSTQVWLYITTSLWVNKRATDEHLTRYWYTGSGETQPVHENILRGLTDKRALSTLNRCDSSMVDWDLDY